MVHGLGPAASRRESAVELGGRGIGVLRGGRESVLLGGHRVVVVRWAEVIALLAGAAKGCLAGTLGAVEGVKTVKRAAVLAETFRSVLMHEDALSFGAVGAECGARALGTPASSDVDAAMVLAQDGRVT
jgi:hypothetical protein